MLTVESTRIADVKIVIPQRFSDDRGWFCETYNRDAFFASGIELEFIQDNQAMSVHAGTVRGLHFQIPPKAQDKLIRVLSGRILDVAVDIRRSSPTYGKWVAEELSAANQKQLFVPAGFAHGYCTLEGNTEVAYKVTNPYSPQHELGIAWDDPDLAIDWQLTDDAILSPKDAKLPGIGSLPEYFA
jgi:dTDP-4-dehydrorhamnose 3,5-epimerase